MALIVETGANVPNSNAYITVEYADNYHAVYRNTDWTALDNGVAEDLELKELAIIRATQAVDALYGERYAAPPAYNEQSLLFPAFPFAKNQWQVVSQGTIPKELKDAVCELALKDLQGESLYPEDDRERDVQTYSAEIGELKESKTYFRSRGDTEYQGFDKIEKILRPILRKGSGGSGIVRL